MPRIEARWNFEPSLDRRKLWLGTRKETIKCGTLTLPGFYNTVGYANDGRWFVFAIAIELIAIALVIYGGLNSNDETMLLIAIGTACAIIPFDLLGAVFLHSRKSAQCLIDNQIVLRKNEEGAEDGLLARKSKGWGLSWFGGFLILLSGSLKIVSVFLITVVEGPLLALLILLYGVVIYVHFRHTGYAITEWWAGKMFKKEYSKWAARVADEDQGEEQGNNARILETPFKSEVTLRLNDKGVIQVGGHTILEDDKAEKKSKQHYYMLRTVGILLDSDIKLFLVGMNPEQAAVIGLACLNHQLNAIHQVGNYDHA